MEIGVLGLGRGATLASHFVADPRIAAVHVVDSDPGVPTPAGCSRVEDLHELLARKPALVVVATPAPLHHSQCLAVLGAGVHVLCETPPFTSIGQAHELAAAVSPAAGIMLAEDYLWLDWMNAVSNDVANGLLGELLSGHASYREDARSLFADSQSQPTWRGSMTPLHYLTHTLGPLLTLMSDRVVTAWGFAAKVDGSPGADRPDSAHAVFQTEQGRFIEMSVGFGAAYPFGFELELVGSTGTRRLEHWTEGRALEAGDKAGIEGWVSAHDESLEEEGAARRTRAMVTHVIDVLHGQEMPRCGLEHLLRFTLPGIAAAASAASGSQPVPVPDHRLWL